MKMKKKKKKKKNQRKKETCKQNGAEPKEYVNCSCLWQGKQTNKQITTTTTAKNGVTIIPNFSLILPSFPLTAYFSLS